MCGTPCTEFLIMSRLLDWTVQFRGIQEVVLRNEAFWSGSVNHYIKSRTTFNFAQNMQLHNINRSNEIYWELSAKKKHGRFAWHDTASLKEGIPITWKRCIVKREVKVGNYFTKLHFKIKKNRLFSRKHELRKCFVKRK